MKRTPALAAVVLVLATPAAADLAPGARAPDFAAKAFVAGKPFDFRLSQALKKGPVVLYFFPAAFTKGCNIEAHLFSEAADDFKAQKATVVGVTAGNTDQLAAFSSDTRYCGGKFPVAADPGAKIAKQYDAPFKLGSFKPPTELSARTSYVIAPDGKVIHAYTAMAPEGHITETLAAVKAWQAKRK